VADRKVSLIIAARDTASKTVQTMATAVSAHAKKIGMAFKAAGAAAQSIHAGLEIAKKVMAVLGAAYDRTIGKALELRAANDPAKKSITEMGEATDRLGTAVGNVLVPMLAAAAGALSPIVDSAAKWLDLNRTMIASRFVPWLADMGKTLVSGVATGFVLAAKAAYGLKMATGAVEDGYHQAQAAVARDAATRIKAAVMDEDLRSWEREAMLGRLEEQEKLAKSHEDAAEASARGVGQAIADLAALEEKAAGVAVVIQQGVGDAAADVFARLGKAAVLASGPVKKLTGDMSAHVEVARAFAATQNAEVTNKAIEAMRIESQQRIAMLERRNADIATYDAKLSLAEDARKEKTTAALEAQQDQVRGLSRSIADAGVGGIMGVLRGAENAGDAILGFFAGVGEAILSTIAESAAAAAASGIFNILTGGLGGTLLGGLGSIFGLQDGGLVGAIPAATGGLVIGGSAHVDSVPIMSMPGEYITPANEVRENIAAGRSPGDSGDSRGGRGGGGGSLTVVASAPTFMPESSADFDRRLNNALIPALKRLKRAGVEF